MDKSRGLTAASAFVRRWKGALAALAVVAAASLVVDNAPSPVVTPIAETAAPTPTPRPLVESASGLRLYVPDGWTFNDDPANVNRAVLRHFFLSSEPLVPPAPTASWDRVSTGAVVLELWEYGGPPAIGQAAPETEFPLRWADATALPDQSGIEARRLPFQHAFRPLAFVAHVGRTARAEDRAAIGRVVASVEPLLVPDRGTYLGAYVAGPFDAFPVGSISRVSVGGPRDRLGLFIVRGQKSVFAFHDRAFQSYGGMFECPLRFDSSERVFFCDASGDRWDRVGNPLTAASQFSLEWAPTAVRDGKVLIKPSRMGGAFTRDETVEFGDAAPAIATTVLSGQEIIRRALSLASDGSPSAAQGKLVSKDQILRANVYPGLRLADDPVWLVVVTRDPRTGPPAPHGGGGWTMFVFDTHGRLLGVSCCAGEGPSGFAALTDQTGPTQGFAPARECGPTDERPLTWDAAARQCAWDAYSAGVPFRWKLTAYTVEGDPMPIVLTFDGSLLLLSRDMRSDQFSTPQDRRISDWTCRTMSKQPWATDATRYYFALSGCTGESRSASVP